MGVLFLLFYLGLEFSIGKLIKSGRSIAVGGSIYSELSINFKLMIPIVGACGPTIIPRTIKKGMIENLIRFAIKAAIATSKSAVPTSNTR